MSGLLNVPSRLVLKNLNLSLCSWFVLRLLDLLFLLTFKKIEEELPIELLQKGFSITDTEVATHPTLELSVK